ncbi:MAG TPA: cyclodeaminase/cyclohydrolase family protein [Solirubrobacteraceae bacterium]|nr:cyclodeaminase/cyclohydrolase family protein [Solirubrobacteraceae bacterium]
MFADGGSTMDTLAHERLGAVVDAMAGREPLPAAGAALAIALSMAAALLVKAASAPRDGTAIDAAAQARAGRLRHDALRLADEDGVAYRRVVAAKSAGGGERMRHALEQASEPPLAMAQIGLELARLAESLLDVVPLSLQGEVRAAAQMSCSATIAAADLVRIDVGDERDERSRQAVLLAGDAGVLGQALAARPLRG